MMSRLNLGDIQVGDVSDCDSVSLYHADIGIVDSVGSGQDICPVLSAISGPMHFLLLLRCCHLPFLAKYLPKLLAVPFCLACPFGSWLSPALCRTGTIQNDQKWKTQLDTQQTTALMSINTPFLISQLVCFTVKNGCPFRQRFRIWFLGGLSSTQRIRKRHPRRAVRSRSRHPRRSVGATRVTSGIADIPSRFLCRRSRSQYRQSRIASYRNYTNVLDTDSPAYKEYLQALTVEAVQPRATQFFDFLANTRRVTSSIVHFQLRNLLRATSKHDIYVMRHNCVNHWDLMSYRCTQVLNLQGGTSGPLMSSIGTVSISTLCTGGGLLVTGGFAGQMVVQRLSDLEIVHESFITQSNNGITNAIEVFGTEGDRKILTSNNDSCLRVFDTTNFKMQFKYECNWPVNYSTVSLHDPKVVAVVGDDLEGLLLDQTSNRLISKFKGHKDFSFAAAWNPREPFQLATGNQDVTTRIWDVRRLDTELKILKGRMGAIRSLRYANDGSFLIMAEPTDFVHVFDVKSDYQKSQEIDLFGEISGMAFSPDADMLFISVFDETYGSLVQFRKKPTDDAMYDYQKL